MNQQMSNFLSPVKSEPLEALQSKGIKHGFFTREGGVSNGIYDSLNVGLGSDDQAENIHENRARIARALDVRPDNLCGCYQIHSPDVITVSEPHRSNRPKADGLATATQGLALGILTADCGPILIADGSAGVVGACHAGWQGALGGVAENTISAMEKLGAQRKNITAVLGPCISQKNYEVGPEFEARFRAEDDGFKRYFAQSPKADHFQFDLQNFIVDRLTRAGVMAHRTGECTYDDEQRFFSYRRKTHRNEPDYGRQMSAICLV